MQQALTGEHVLNFAGADAESQRAECAVRGGVAVAADYGHAGLRAAEFRPDDVHDAAPGRIHAKKLDAELRAIIRQLLQLRRRLRVSHGQRERGGGDGVVHGR